MENVKGLLSMQNGKVIKTIVEEFTNAGMGYNVEYKVLRASDYGVPQMRERDGGFPIFLPFRAGACYQQPRRAG